MTIITNMPMYRVIVLKSALKMYHESGIRPNRAYTPTAMLRAAGSITGKDYKRGHFKEAITDLGQWLEVHRLMGENLQDVRPL